MAEATIPDSAVDDLPWRGGALRLFIAWPETPPPPGGWPVLYVLDGNRSFPYAVAAARAQAMRPALTGVVPALVVGLGYSDAAAAAREARTRDYTPPAPPARLKPRPNGQPWGETGGAPEFLRLLRDAVLPRIESSYPADPARRVLFGHSLGGLFTLFAAFTAPGLFQSYLASSPSIWFGERIVLDHAAGFGDRLALLGARRALMISVGALEQTVPRERRAAVGAAYVGWVAQNRMVGNAIELADLLAPLTAQGLDLTLRLLADETHVTAPPVALGHGLRLALRPGMD